ncbi:hypothetical protein QCN29_24480 [Streptomyces sp. HNM0663]|uniref:Secreted protein n=1 Tax=Streptomyces chengmaiensis TaxID=3040919 RepID=A0ABT6HVL0_9ACTN|nr:hypothetical protein [Streptomyces chengmaiensis]MDH2391879.1 hypothetical protein [Streptomyces chengmaiensis]
MARHAAPSNQRRALLCAGLAVAAAAGAVLGAGGGAHAAQTDAGEGLSHALPGALGPVKSLQLDPLANTGVDPLDNAVGTQVADFPPVSTALATDPVAKGGSLGTLPLVGQVAGLLPG